MRDHNADRDWKASSERCLVAALDKAREMIEAGDDSAKLKTLESVIKTVGDVVGAAGYLNKRAGTVAHDGSDDE
jgi:hypothetical protein